MKKIALVFIVLLSITCINAQELKVKDNHFYSEKIIPSYGLTLSQSLSAIESLLLKQSGIEKVLSVNHDANFIAIQFAYEANKDPLNRQEYCYADARCFIKNDSIKVIIDNFKISYYTTNNANAKTKFTYIKTKLGLEDDIVGYLTLINDQIYDIIQLALLEHKRIWNF